MSTFATYLAAALSERLAAVVPAGFQVSALHGALTISASADNSWATSQLGAIVDQPGDRSRNAALAAQSALNAVQDFVTETLAEPWPDIGRRNEPWPQSHACIEDGKLLLWYGDPTTRSSRCPRSTSPTQRTPERHSRATRGSETVTCDLLTFDSAGPESGLG